MLGRRDILAGIRGRGAGRRRHGRRAFPDRPLRWVVGYPPGGASDVFARLIGTHIGAKLGQAVVVENRPGGGAVVASEAVVRSPGRWLHACCTSTTASSSTTRRSTAGCPTTPTGTSRASASSAASRCSSWCARTARCRILPSFVARSKPQAPNYGTPAVASPHHLAMEMVKRRTGLEATHVPYRGGPAAMQDLLAGNVDAVVIDCATGIPFITTGRVRALCVFSEARAPRAPDVPTLRELGFANAVAYGWQGMSVAAAVPAPIVARLAEGLKAGVARRGCPGPLPRPRHRERALEPGRVPGFREARECRMAAADPRAGHPAG